MGDSGLGSKVQYKWEAGQGFVCHHRSLMSGPQYATFPSEIIAGNELPL